MIRDRWEHGSDHHWIDPTDTAIYPWTSQFRLFGSGRHANDALVRTLCCRRLWLPSFFCQEVAAALPSGLALATYPDRPGELAATLEHLPFSDGDAVLVVNTLGLRAAPPTIPPGVLVIEDHTHDLLGDWAMNSNADYCVASLRKLLPVPDGGVVWSPHNRSLPQSSPLEPIHLIAASSRLSAMVLKAAYLAGGAVEKQTFRTLAMDGEAAIAAGPPTDASPFTHSVLPAFPTRTWRLARERNFRLVSDAVADLPHARLLAPAPGAVSFAVTLVFDTAIRRDAVRLALVQQRIYPAVLWSLQQPVTAVGNADVELSRRILSVHCDHRYNDDDMRRVVSALQTTLT